MTAHVLMVQGTASSVGKSLLTAGLCRIYARRGFKVAPFKSQNMSLNSFVTPDGGEIGRAQAVQAEAAGCVPSVQMNPILLKPEGQSQCQVIVAGRVVEPMSAVDYHAYKPELRRTIDSALRQLRATHDLVIIEGAGSPAEINLKDDDIANMFVADLADSPVVLVGDIDRGGVFASLVGTMELLDPHERRRVRGLIINKFRGDPALLGNGLSFLHERTGVPVLGVVPHIENLHIADEDSTALDERTGRIPVQHGVTSNDIYIAVVRLPHVSNYDDVLPLEREHGVHVRFTRSAQDVQRADLVVVPGTKCTVDDLAWLREHGLATALTRRAERGGLILGICGGCQILGRRIEDPGRIESEVPSVAGLGLLPFTTHYRPTKTTAQVVARVATETYLSTSAPIEGYEIHAGEIVHDAGAVVPFRLIGRNGQTVDREDGAVSDNGAVVGTMIHGILDNAGVRASLLRRLQDRPILREREGGDERSVMSEQHDRMREYDRLADALEGSISMACLDRIIAPTGELDGAR